MCKDIIIYLTLYRSKNNGNRVRCDAMRCNIILMHTKYKSPIPNKKGIPNKLTKHIDINDKCINILFVYYLTPSPIKLLFAHYIF